MPLEEFARVVLEILPPSPGDARALRRQGRELDAEIAEIHQQLEVAVRRLQRLDARRRVADPAPERRKPEYVRVLREGHLTQYAEITAAEETAAAESTRRLAEEGIDPDRFRAFLAAALSAHPDQDGIDRRLRAGESFWIEPRVDGRCDVLLGGPAGLPIASYTHGDLAA